MRSAAESRHGCELFTKSDLDNSHLFEHVGRANAEDLKAVEKILANQPELIFEQGKLVEPNGREFHCISAWQHVLWSGDPDLLPMMLNYVSNNPSQMRKALSQNKQRMERPKEIGNYGSYYDIQPLIDLEQEYLDNYGGWSYQECQDHLCKKAAIKQCLLPAWIMYAWYELGSGAWTKKLDFTYWGGEKFIREAHAIGCFLDPDLGQGSAVFRGDKVSLYTRGDWSRLSRYVSHDVEMLKRCRVTQEVQDKINTAVAGSTNRRVCLR